jgi:hypothetical protein
MRLGKPQKISIGVHDNKLPHPEVQCIAALALFFHFQENAIPIANTGRMQGVDVLDCDCQIDAPTLGLGAFFCRPITLCRHTALNHDDFGSSVVKTCKALPRPPIKLKKTNGLCAEVQALNKV